MADRNTIFVLDEIEEEELGGFNDAPEMHNPDESDKEETDTGDKDDDQGADDNQSEEPGEPEPKDEPKDEPEPKDTVPEKVEPKPAEQKKASNEFDVNTAVATIARLTEQNNKLMDRLDKPKESQEAPAAPEKPSFTQKQWDDDPQGCNDALFEYHDQRRAHETNTQETAQQAATEQKQKQLNTAHKEAWDLSLEVMPELADNQKARQAWATIFNNQKTGFNLDPNGPLKATRALRKFMKEKDLSFDGQDAKPAGDTQAPQDTHQQDSQEAARKAAEDESSRQRRVRSQSMHTGGKGGKSTINLTPDQKSVCRQMSISEQAYMDSLTALGGGK